MTANIHQESKYAHVFLQSVSGKWNTVWSLGNPKRLLSNSGAQHAKFKKKKKTLRQVISDLINNSISASISERENKQKEKNANIFLEIHCYHGKS